VNATEQSRLSSGYEYSPSAVEINTAVEMVTIEVHSIHFRNDSLGVDENEAIRKLQIARRELKEARERLYLFPFNSGGGVTYLHTVIAVGVVGLAVGFAYFVYYSRMVGEKRHQEMRRIVADSVYGTQIYEQVDRCPEVLQPRRPTININMQQLPTTTAPIPGTPARA